MNNNNSNLCVSRSINSIIRCFLREQKVATLPLSLVNPPTPTPCHPPSFKYPPKCIPHPHPQCIHIHIHIHTSLGPFYRTVQPSSDSEPRSRRRRIALADDHIVFGSEHREPGFIWSWDLVVSVVVGSVFHRIDSISSSSSVWWCSLPFCCAR